MKQTQWAGAVVVLAGGQGSRIGGHKPLRLLSGERLIDRAVRQSRRWSDLVGSRIGPLRLVGLGSSITLAVVAALLDAQAALLVGCFVLAGGLAMAWNGLSFTAAAVLSATAATLSFTVPASAQHAREAEIIGFHQLCERGDRKACIRFGMILGENRARHAEWRRLHPDWWGWER